MGTRGDDHTPQVAVRSRATIDTVRGDSHLGNCARGALRSKPVTARLHVLLLCDISEDSGRGTDSLEHSIKDSGPQCRGRIASAALTALFDSQDR